MSAGIVIAVVVFFSAVFFVFILIFRRIINKNISSAVQHLDQINQDYVDKQDQANKKLEEAERVYKDTVSKAKEEALGLRQELLKQSQQEQNSIIQKAQAQSQDIIQQAEKTRSVLISELEKRINAEAVKKASVILGEVLPKDAGIQIHSYLVKEFIDSASDKLDKLSVPRDADEVKIVSAFSLEDKQKQAILKIVKEKTGKELKINEEIDSGLVAGFMVVLGSLVVDNSLRFKIAEKAREIAGKE